MKYSYIRKRLFGCLDYVESTYVSSTVAGIVELFSSEMGSPETGEFALRAKYPHSKANTFIPYKLFSENNGFFGKSSNVCTSPCILLSFKLHECGLLFCFSYLDHPRQK